MPFRISAVVPACLALLLAAASTASAATYDALSDFSLDGNPNGVWSYGEGTAGGSDFLAFVNKITTSSPDLNGWQSSTPSLGTPAVIKNIGSPAATGGVVFLTDVLDIHPGMSSDVIVRFTAPVAATYSYSGLFEILDAVNPTGIVGLIFKGETNLFSQALSGAQKADSVELKAGGMMTFGGAVFLKAGETLDFAVNNGGNYVYDSTGFKATIVGTTGPAPVPVPASLPLVASGVSALALAARKRRKTR